MSGMIFSLTSGVLLEIRGDPSNGYYLGAVTKGSAPYYPTEDGLLHYLEEAFREGHRRIQNRRKELANEKSPSRKSAEELCREIIDFLDAEVEIDEDLREQLTQRYEQALEDYAKLLREAAK